MDPASIVIPPPAGARRLILAADPANETDWFAVALVEATRRGETATYVVRHLERSRQAGYDATARRLVQLAAAAGSHFIALDATGLGGPVVEMVKAKLDPAARKNVVAVTATGAEEPSFRNASKWSVPKVVLVESMVVAFEQGQLRLPTALPLLDEFTKELEAFKRTVRDTGKPKYEGGGNIHDDLVSAVAIGCYVGKVMVGRARAVEVDVGTPNRSLEKDASSYRWTFPLSPEVDR